MRTLKPFRIPPHLVTLGVIFLCMLQPGHQPAATRRIDPRAYIERGDVVERRYEAYSRRLAQYHETLLAAVKKYAPELVASLQPRRPLAYGYQVLPRIIADARADNRAPIGPVAYSWPWTDRLIDDELRQIAESETELSRAARSLRRRAVLAALVRRYELQSQRLRDIHAHVQYNRLWQAAIARDRAGYDRENTLYGALLEHRKVTGQLNRVLGESAIARPSSRTSFGLAALTTKLRLQEALLTRRIDQSMGGAQVPSFVRLETSKNEWIFHVPLCTDVEDAAYVAALKEIIESVWRLKDGDKSYRVELDVTYLSTETLYGDDEKPSSGEKLNVEGHLKRFPFGSAILTTGARSTHVENDAIVLGPHPLPPRVLAHEFGHILGFRDRYARGYMDLGEDGFQMMEALDDTGDIMAATAQGTVQRGHFLKLIESARPATQGDGLFSLTSGPATRDSEKTQIIGGPRFDGAK